MDPLTLVGLHRLMAMTKGSRWLVIGLIDGPVDPSHRGLSGSLLRFHGGGPGGADGPDGGTACLHGTFVAGILAGDPGGGAPGICPGCPLLVRSVFRGGEGAAWVKPIPPDVLAGAILDCMDSGARLLSLSLGFSSPNVREERRLSEALDEAARRGVLVIAAAGNQGTLGSTGITRHPWVIPVAACDREGQPLALSNLGTSFGRRGLLAPGDRIVSLGPRDSLVTMSGTSAAVPFVTATAALAWSLFPRTRPEGLREALLLAGSRRRRLVPPLLDAWGAFQAIAAGQEGGIAT